MLSEIIIQVVISNPYTALAGSNLLGLFFCLFIDLFLEHFLVIILVVA